MTKKDPYNHKERYLKWKKRTRDGIPGISEKNSKIIKQYLEDMRNSINISPDNKKGPRSYCRLNTLREKMIYFSKMFKCRNSTSFQLVIRIEAEFRASRK